MIKLKLIDRRNQEFEFTEGEHFLGRGPLLQINDPKCSKKQAKLVISEKKILLHSMGKNPMSLYSPQIGWRKIAKDQQTVLHNGDTINLLLNYYPYKISIENTEKKEKEDERFVPDYNDSSQEASLIIEEVFAADPDPPTKNNNNSTNGHKNSSNNNNASRKVDNEDLSIDLNQIEDEPDSPQITNDGDLPPVSLADAISEENKKSREREADEKRKKDEELRKEAEKKKKQEEMDLNNLERKKEEERKQAQNSPKKNNTTFRALFSQKNNTLSKDEVQLPEVKSSAPKFSLGSKLDSPPSPNKASGTASTNNGNTLTGQKRSRENDSKEQSTPNKRAKTAVSRVIDLDEIDSQSEEQKRIEAEILKKKRREEEDEELARKLQKKEEELEQKRKDKEFIDDDIDDSEGDFEDEKKSSNKKNNKKKQQKSSGSKSGSTPKKQVNKKKRVISSDDEASDSEISFDKPALGDDFYKRHSPKANATVTVTPKSTVTVTKKGNTSIPVDESSSGSEDIGKSPNKKTSPNKANNSPRKPTTRSNKKTAKVHTELKYPIDDDDFQ